MRKEGIHMIPVEVYPRPSERLATRTKVLADTFMNIPDAYTIDCAHADAELDHQENLRGKSDEDMEGTAVNEAAEKFYDNESVPETRLTQSDL